MSTYTDITKEDMINWKLSLIHLAELIKHDFHKELLAYLIIQLFEYCLILSYLNVTVSKEISKSSITIKYIHNYVNDTSLYSTITSFTARRNDLCHKPLTEITYKYLIELITNDKFLVLLKRVVPDDLYIELEETLSIVRSKINSCNKDIFMLQT